MKSTMAWICIAAMALSIACTNSAATKQKEEEEQMLILALGAAALSRASTLPIQGSCAVTATSCVDYHTGWSNAQMTADCGGTLTIGGSGCSATNRVASCYMVGRGTGATTVSGATATARYASPSYTVATATTGCNSAGGTLSVP